MSRAYSTQVWFKLFKNGASSDMAVDGGTPAHFDVVADFTDGVNIKKNSDFSLLAGVDGTTVFAAGDDHLPIRWTLSKGLGVPLELVSGQKLRITVQDDLSDLTVFNAMAQGMYRSEQ